MVWPHGQEELDCFREHLNRPHLKIKFTVEVEKNNNLAYLNVHVTRSDTKLRTLTSGNTAQSAVAKHAAEQSHVIDWNEAKVMACHPHYRQRCALEAWHIHTEAQTMNRDAGPLPSVYDPLIHQSHP